MNDIRDTLIAMGECIRQLQYPAGRRPLNPTAAWPGSAAKIAVMRRRASRGESLFHPDDARPDSGRLAS